MNYIPLFLRHIITLRANYRCEYCQLSQKGQEATFHVDHIIPMASGGETIGDNLALACVSCSLRKGAKEFVIDEITKTTVRIFHPRKDAWEDHFKWRGFLVKGITEKGRATVKILNLNRDLILEIRKEEFLLKRHPFNL